MVKDIVRDTEKLSVPCRMVRNTDKEELTQLIQDMKDTAEYWVDERGCVGLAANQIGSNLRVVLCKLDNNWVTMINPAITKVSKSTMMSEEGCLSLDGTRNVKRYCSVTVLYSDENGKSRTLTVKGFNATVVQHETDHLKGKLI